MAEFFWYGVALFLSMFIAAKLGPHVHTFRWIKYFIFIAFPVTVVFAYAYLYDVRIVGVYLAAGFIGTAAEYTFGRLWHMAMGHRLWEYWRYAPGGYTSLLVLPLWGTAGVFFFLLGKVFFA